MCILKYPLTQLENGSEILVHLSFEFFNLVLCELTFGVVKDFLRKHFQNTEIILADIQIAHRATTDVTDKIFPSCVPFVFDDLD